MRTTLVLPVAERNRMRTAWGNVWKWLFLWIAESSVSFAIRPKICRGVNFFCFVYTVNEFFKHQYNITIKIHLHANDGVYEEKHDDQQRDVRQGLEWFYERPQ